MKHTALSTEIRIGPVTLRIRARRTAGGWKFQARGHLPDAPPPHLPAPKMKTLSPPRTTPNPHP